MNIKTRHGYETPLTTDLEDYQLGWSIEDGCLYIKDPNAESENKVLRVVSDKSLLESRFAEAMKENLNAYSDEEIAKAKEELKKLYEKKTTYVIEFGVPLDEEKEDGVDYTVDTPFEYYTKNSADEAVADFIKNLSVINEGAALVDGQDPNISNAGSKIIISKADHSFACLYMILEDDNGKEYGQLINILEQSFPSLCLEWSEKKENTLEFKLNEEVLNSIDFNSMVIDEGTWEHNTGKLDFAQLIPGMKEYDYIHPVSPICVRAVKNCKIKPTSTTSYGDVAYGYSSNPNTMMANFESSNESLAATSEGNVSWLPTSKPITQKISDAVDRGKYFSVFRVKSGYDDGIPSMEKIGGANGSIYNYNTISTLHNQHRGLVEVYNPKDKRWEFFVPFSGYEVSTENKIHSFGCAYPGVIWDAPTSSKPIVLNTGYSRNTTSNNMQKFCCNLRRGWFTSEANRSTYYSVVSDVNVSAIHATNYALNINSLITTNDSPLYTTLYKIPINEYVPIDEGYDYTFLEALDYYSRAYWVPQYMDFERTKVQQQLVDIYQIMLKNANAVKYGYDSIGITNWSNTNNSAEAPILPISLTYDSRYDYFYESTRCWSTTSSDAACSPSSAQSTSGPLRSKNAKIQPGTRFKDRTATVFTNNDIGNFISSDTDTAFSKCFVNNSLIHTCSSTESTTGRFVGTESTSSSTNDYAHVGYLPCQRGVGGTRASTGYYSSYYSYVFNVPYASYGANKSMVSFSEIYGFAKGLDGFSVVPRD